MLFLLGEDARENAKRSLRALRAHADGREPIHLVVNTKIHLIATKDFTPRIIPVTHKLHKVGEKTFALIARDTAYRQPLTCAGAATEDLLHEIIPFKKVQLMGHSKKALLRLFKENDVIVADTRIHHRLPDILGQQFYGKNRKVPFKIQMARPEAGKVPRGRSDTLCDPKFVKAQLKLIAGNTSYLPPANGTCFHVVVGYSDWKVLELLTNINDVISYLVEEKYAPVGGLLKSLGNLHSVLVKTSNSVAMPVKNKEVKETEEFSD